MASLEVLYDLLVEEEDPRPGSHMGKLTFQLKLKMDCCHTAAHSGVAPKDSGEEQSFQWVVIN